MMDAPCLAGCASAASQRKAAIWASRATLAAFPLLALRASVVWGSLCWALLALTAGESWAASGGVQILPVPGTKMKNSLRLKLDTRWVDANGYRPLRVTATTQPPGPAPADRQIRVEILPYDYSSGAWKSKYSQIIDIPAGSASVETVMAVPQDSMWYAIGVNVYEGGDKLEDLSVEMLSLPRSNYWNWTEASPTILVIDADMPLQLQRDVVYTNYKATRSDKNPTHNLPDVRNFARMFPENQFAGQMIDLSESKKQTDAAIITDLADMPRAEILPPAELPTKWLELSTFDVSFVSVGDLAGMKAQHPEQFRALRDWLATGTTLCVYDVGTNFERLREVEQLLALPPVSNPQGDQKFRGWRAAAPQQHTADLIGYDVNAQSQYRNVYPGAQQMLPVPASANTKKLKSPANLPFASRPAGLGYVIAIAAENPFPGQREDWVWLLNSVPHDHWMWYKRHGFSLHRENDEFWNCLIPGVGMAPVVTFLLLISLFAVLIGPVNYLVLGRMQRLYLLLVTVPAGAALVTVAMLGYAVLTDGLGVRLRTRSFTEIDQRTGQVASWSRQSYYASIAPSQGLHYPADTAVYPIIHQPTARNNSRRNVTAKTLDWSDEGQQLRRGYIYSRTASQFMTVRAGQTESRLKVHAGSPPRVENHLGTAIHHLLLRTADGSYFAVQSLPPQGEATLAPSSLAEQRTQLGSIATTSATQFPQGYDPSMHENLVSWMMPNYGGWSIDGGASSPTMAVSVLESNLSRLDYPRADPIEPGMYLAIVDAPPDVPLGVEGAREKLSLHVIRGRW